MLFYNTLPLYGEILGAAFLGEPLGMIHYFFGRLIIAGGLWGTLGKENQAQQRKVEIGSPWFVKVYL